MTQRIADFGLVFISMENWDAHWRRNQFICSELLRRHSKLQILFVGLPRNFSHAIRHLRPLEFFQASTYPAPGFERVTVTHAGKWLPDSLPSGRRFNEWALRWHVRREAGRLGIQSPLLWLNPHHAVHMVGKMNELACIYDITDDWTTLTQSSRQAELTRRQDAELCARADAAIVCSPRLFEMKRGIAANLHLVANGVEVAHYAGISTGALPLPAQASGWKRPVLGYTGTIHPDRVDVELVAALATGHTGSVVLIGPNHLSPQDNRRLAQLENVHLVGPVAYSEIPSYMTVFDVCITPHKMTPFTESLNPIKLWEYLASGLPVVSTDVAGFREYGRLVRIARDADEFLQHVAAALAEPKSAGEARRAEAARHSWSARVDQIEAAIASALDARRQKCAAGPNRPPKAQSTRVA